MDASYKIQRGIHVHLIQFFMCPEFCVFVKRKCEQKGPKKVSTFSTRFHVVSNVFPKYQMLTF